MAFLKDLPSRLLKRILVRECKRCIFAKIFVHPCHRDFSRESLCENAENESPRIPAIATFPESPCAAVQKVSPSNVCAGPLASRLFERILVREHRTYTRAMVARDPCRRDFSKEYLCENAENVSEHWSCRTPRDFRRILVRERRKYI